MPKLSGNRCADLISIRLASLLIAVSLAAVKALLDFRMPLALTLRRERYDHCDQGRGV
jgi:hypothetical protein